MHLKNFSMMENPSGWGLAPAYDLLNVSILIPEDSEELALTLAGKKKNLNWIHFEKLGKNLELTDKQIQGDYKRMVKNKSKANDWINKSFLSDKMKEAYTQLVEKRHEKLI